MLLLLFVWMLSRCGADETVQTPSPTTTTPPTTEVQRAQLATATKLQVSLEGPAYEGVAAVIDSKVYLLGGLNAQKQSTKAITVFDPVANSVTNAGELTTATHDAMGGAIGNTAFVFGGNAGNKTFDTVEAFIPGSNAASATAKLPAARSDGVAVSSDARDSLFVVGGSGDKGAAATDVLGTSDGKLFSPRAVLAESVRYPAAVMDGNVIWVIGGEQNNQPTDLIQKVDLASGTASVVGRLPFPISRAATFELGNSIFLAGGKSGDGPSDSIRRFDADKLTVVDAGKLPDPTTDAMVATIGETVYLVGGQNPKPTRDIVAITAK